MAGRLRHVYAWTGSAVLTLGLCACGSGKPVAADSRDTALATETPAMPDGSTDGAQQPDDVTTDAEARMADPARTAAETSSPQRDGRRVRTTTVRSGNPLRVERIVKDSGLVIEEMSSGSGAQCMSAADTVTVHYRGTLENGEEFDSSKGGKPITFPLSQLIEGWKQGIPGMKEGGKRKLTIPWQLAYGERAVKGSDGSVIIPAKSNLIFEIELIKVKSK
jgi:FKBP-type peptidyl-prolyl cis-trans isomerase